MHRAVEAAAGVAGKSYLTFELLVNIMTDLGSSSAVCMLRGEQDAMCHGAMKELVCEIFLSILTCTRIGSGM
jgi:hypothetical protein